MRKLIIFGNGIGRALDNAYFDLSAAMRVAWADNDTLDGAQRELIRKCLPKPDLIDDETEAPGEHHLDNLQRVLAACDEIAKFEQDGDGWLNENGRAFPNAIRSFIHRTAAYFHDSSHRLPQSFVDKLIKHVAESRSHIATLNYDELLYSAFINKSIFYGYDCLIDGFLKKGFSNAHLQRKQPQRQSFYLHLHGSPLYYQDEFGDLRKAALRDLPELHGYSSTHIVLTDVKHKLAVIQASEILRAYWARLKEALQEIDGLVLVGYGGADTHLNQHICAHFRGKQVEIVERAHTEYNTRQGYQKRSQFWEEAIGHKPAFFWKENILDHTYWDWKA